MKLLLVAAAAALSTAPALAQCGTLSQDFESLTVGTNIVTLTAWQSSSSTPPASVEIGSGSNTSNVVEMRTLLGGALSRKIPPSLQTSFHLSFDVKVGADASFQIDCPFNPTQIGVRARVQFDTTNFVVSSNITPGATLPLSTDFATMEVFGDVSGLVRIFYDGQLLDEYPWAMAGNICNLAKSFTFLQPGSTSGFATIEVDNVCMGPWLIGTNFCQSNPNSTGVNGVITGTGSESLSSNNLVLTASSLPANSFGYFFVGSASAFIANPGGSQGNFCVGGQPARYLPAANTGAAGQLQLAVDLLSIPHPTGTVAAQVGETWYFQSWFRDSIAGQPVSNFTDGLSIQVAQ